MTMRVYDQAALALRSGTKVTTTTNGEPLVPDTDAPVDSSYEVILQPGGAYSVNVGYAVDHTEFVIPQGGSLTIKIDQLSKIFVKTTQAGQAVNYIWFR
jgi:hypothetical protein